MQTNRIQISASRALPTRMRRLATGCASVLLANLAPALAAPSLPPPQQVDIQQQGVLLHATIYKPEGAGPFPLVIAAHDCGGLQGRASQVRSHYRDWAEQLIKAGYAVMLPDSYGSRDLGPQCRVKDSHVRAANERAGDLQTSQQWAAGQPWVQRSRISLLGWGEGADALLSVIRLRQGVRHASADFRSAIAFYPDCARPSSLGWSARVPTLLLSGEDDDVNPSAVCRQMIDDTKGRSAFAKFVGYSGAHHGFDRAGIAVQPVAQQADADLPERGHIGTSTKARTDAQKRVVRWLGR